MIQAIRDDQQEGYNDYEYESGAAHLQDDPVAEEESGGEEDDEAYESWDEGEVDDTNWGDACQDECWEGSGKDANAWEAGEPAAENQEDAEAPSAADEPPPEQPATKKRSSSLKRRTSRTKLRRMGSYRRKRSTVSIASSAPETPQAKLPRADTAESYVDPDTAAKQAELNKLLDKIGAMHVKLLACRIIGTQFHLDPS